MLAEILLLFLEIDWHYHNSGPERVLIVNFFGLVTWVTYRFCDNRTQHVMWTYIFFFEQGALILFVYIKNIGLLIITCLISSIFTILDDMSGICMKIPTSFLPYYSMLPKSFPLKW